MPASDADYAFEMASSSVRYGPGVTAEIGWDLKNLKAQNVLVMTDANMAQLLPTKTVVDSLNKAGVKFTLYDQVRVEPSDARHVSFFFFVVVVPGLTHVDTINTQLQGRDQARSHPQL